MSSRTLPASQEKKSSGVKRKHEDTDFKECQADRIITFLTRASKRYRANNISEMWKNMAKYTNDDSHKYDIHVWKQIILKPSISKLLSVAVEIQKMEYLHMPFTDLITLYCTQSINLGPQYHNAVDSYYFFLDWISYQGWNATKLIRRIVDVMDRSKQKKNTLALIGESNSGKTIMLAKPLCEIARFVGRIGNRGNASEFLFQELPNTRMVSFEECKCGPEMMEDLKLLFGGEEMKVSVKFEKHATVSRTPVILTGNEPPWVYDIMSAKPLKARMYYYTSKADPQLKNINQLHPGMWWYLIQQYGVRELQEFDQLLPYPVIA